MIIMNIFEIPPPLQLKFLATPLESIDYNETIIIIIKSCSFTVFPVVEYLEMSLHARGQRFLDHGHGVLRRHRPL
jgi:hypothetical protein